MQKVTPAKDRQNIAYLYIAAVSDPVRSVPVSFSAYSANREEGAMDKCCYNAKRSYQRNRWMDVDAPPG